MNYILLTCNSIVYTFPFQKGRFGYSEEILNQNKMGTQPGKHQILQLYVWALVSKDLEGSALHLCCLHPSLYFPLRQVLLHARSSLQHVSYL